METRTHTPTLKESTIVERVARIVSSVRGTKTDYTFLAAELEPAIPFDVFGVVLLRHDRQAVRVAVCQKEHGRWIAQCHQHPFEGSMVEYISQAPSTTVKNYPGGLDGPPAQCGDALSGYRQLQATFIAPLIAGDRLLGTLELGSIVLDSYEDGTLQRLIEAVVRVLAAAIESAQVGGSAEIQDRQRQALKDVSSALTSKKDLSSILNQIVDGIAKALNVASAIVTFDQRQGELRLEAQSGLDPVQLRAIVGRKGAVTDQTIIGYTLRRRQPCVSHDISADERFPGSSSFTTELGMRSIFSYPLVTGTTVYGALLLCSPEPGGFTPLKADILSLFAGQATIAIHNGMLIEAAHQRTRFQHAIEQLERAYEQNEDDQAILARLRQESERTFGVSFSSLLHFISDHLLTRNERDLHTILHSGSEEGDGWDIKPFAPDPGSAGAPFILLTQRAEAALARAEILGELSRLWTQLPLNEAKSADPPGEMDVRFSSSTASPTERNRSLKQSTEHMKDAWFVVDLQGLCIYMNPAAEILCGMHMGTLTENTIEDIFTELLPRIRNAEEVRNYLYDFYPAGRFLSRGVRQPANQGNVYQQDLRCVIATEPVGLAGGELPWLGERYSEPRPATPARSLEGAPSDQYYQLTRRPLFNQQGALIANVLQVHDMTAQVRDEKNKSALLSSVSHDLRTPLTTIKAAVTGLLQIDVEWDEQTRREILEEIDAEADHLGILVNALVEMSRIEMGALILDKEWCDIVEVVHGALFRLERVLALSHRSAETDDSSTTSAGKPAEGNKRLRGIRTEFQPQLPLIYADHVQLERVFYSLIEHIVRNNPGLASIRSGNDALQSEDQGSAPGWLAPNSRPGATAHEDTEIIISVDTVEDNTSNHASTSRTYLRARIIDRACGLPEGERERIFKTFYGLNVRGSGLGLAISRGIVEAHQGQIAVEAAPLGDGLCYVFILPLLSYNGVSSSFRTDPAGSHSEERA